MKTIVGDLFAAIQDKKGIVIAHICNDLGAWGAGFVIPLAKHFPVAREAYLGMKERHLGDVQMLQAGEVNIANMIAQHDVAPDATGRTPIRYGALHACMAIVGDFALTNKLEIVAPKFGAGLAGGNWDFIAALIQECWCDIGIPVTIYEWPAPAKK